MEVIYIKWNQPSGKESYYKITEGKIVSITNRFGISVCKTLPNIPANQLKIIDKDEFEKRCEFLKKEIENL